jgi:hypothetical protein
MARGINWRMPGRCPNNPLAGFVHVCLSFYIQQIPGQAETAAGFPKTIQFENFQIRTKRGPSSHSIMIYIHGQCLHCYVILMDWRKEITN